MKNIDDFIDEYGAICHKTKDLSDLERGDSARETGTYFILNIWSNRMFGPAVKQAFLLPDGSFCRHKYSSTLWHRDPKQFSRDQWTALACASAVNISLITRHDLWNEQKKHVFTAQNGDLITFEYNLYIRMFCLWYLWPLLCLLDIGHIINAIIRIIKNRPSSEVSDNVGDDLNLTSMIYVATQVLPTPTNWIARMIYKTFHPGIQKAWDWYYRHPQNPPQNEVWRPIITKYFT